MQRYFNTEGQCDPEMHYMVRLDGRLGRIKAQFVDRGKYFVINRGRQYGKTTTLMALSEFLKDEYLVFSMDFQQMSSASFENEDKFMAAFIRCFLNGMKNGQDRTLDGKLQESLWY